MVSPLPVPISVAVKRHDLASIRRSLTQSYAEPTALAEYLVAQLQTEIANHEMSAKPNSEPDLSAWNNKTNHLHEMLIGVQELNTALPVIQPPNPAEVDASSVKQSLLKIAAQLDALIKSLDDNTGTLGNFWKVGMIGAASQLLVLCGVGIATAAPIAAGVIGVNTFRVMVGRTKGDQ
jgi:hypothetical protein